MGRLRASPSHDARPTPAPSAAPFRWRAAALGLSILWAPLPAAAYVCARVTDGGGQESGPSLSWTARILDFSLFAAGTEDIPGDDELDVLRASFLAWGRYDDPELGLIGTPPQEATGAGRTTDLIFREAPTLSVRDGVGYDFLHPEENENLLIFRDDAWPQPAQATSVIALTTTTYNALTGEILDADIEFNSAFFHFTTTDPPMPVATDLMNTAVHEIGHMLGLGHSTIPAATMAPTANSGEIDKRDLAPDDRNGIVFKYPAGEPNGYCSPTLAGCTCVPPRSVSNQVQVTASNHHDGLPIEGGCRSVGGGWAPASAGVLLLGLRLCRRRPAPA